MSERIRMQRMPGRRRLGACIALSAEDLSFVDDEAEWLTVEKKPTENGLIIRIGEGV